MDRGVDFYKRQKAAGKPFFLYLQISSTYFPNLPKRFEGESRIGQFGDSIVGMLDTLKDPGLEKETIVVFASPMRAGIASTLDLAPCGSRPFSVIIGSLQQPKWRISHVKKPQHRFRWSLPRSGSDRDLRGRPE